MSPLRFVKSGPASGRIFFGDDCIGEIHDLCLRNMSLEPGGRIVIGNEVPLPLYWRQYAHHEDPARNAGSNPSVEEIPADPGGAGGGPGSDSASSPPLVLRCEGTDARSSIRSRFLLRIGIDLSIPSPGTQVRFVIEIEAELEVLRGHGWQVTYNPDHGELEFCNLWPEGTFVTGQELKKSFSSCFVQRSSTSAVTLIRHHHLESSDKHNIPLKPGDRFGWVLEDRNPVIELLSGLEVSAGLCAYMWDAHFAYRCCSGPGEAWLPPGSRYSASFRISLLDRTQASVLVMHGVHAPAPEALVTPLYRDGLNKFNETLDLSGGGAEAEGQAAAVWPWTFDNGGREALEVEGTLDRSTGYDDNSSLRIRAAGTCTGRWMATTLGPAFGGHPFRDKRRHALSAVVRAESLDGIARIGLRIHRRGAPGLGEPDRYEHYWSPGMCSGTTPWTVLEVLTPHISPPPDRVHILLEQQGRGTAWFDNVWFRESR